MKKNNKKIIISLSGGLGNQMFQFALYTKLSQNGLNVYFDKSWHSIYTKNNHENIKLDYFNINNLKFVSFKEASKYVDYSCLPYKILLKLKVNIFILLKNINRKIIKKINIILLIKYNNKSKYYLLEDTKKSMDLIWNLDGRKSIYLNGTFARYQYINEIKTQLIKSFSFSDDLPECINILLNEIKSKNSVAIHVRRGDYVGDKQRDVCGMFYYQNAINLLSTKYNDLYFYLFSDDIEFLKTNFYFLNNCKIINNSNLDKPEYYDFFLMTQTNHLIISNSTFAWWAAWLNQNNDKNIIAPELFHTDNSWVNSYELYPPEWIKLSIK